MGYSVNVKDKEKNLILSLFKINAVKFGEFKLKSGILSPVYFDLRVMVSYPKVLLQVCDLIWDKMKSAELECRHICGVPYTALPIATCISTAHDIPMLIRRKEKKDYGTSKMVEGHFNQGDYCLIIEDVVTSGSSVHETATTLNAEGLLVKDAIVLLDREQGGSKMLSDKGIKLHSIFSLTQLVTCLRDDKLISDEVVENVKQFITNNNTYKRGILKQINSDKDCYKNKVYVPKTYEERARLCQNIVAKRLFTIMEEKETNLCVSADITSSIDLLEIADKLGPMICMLKTHVDILEDFTPNVSAKLVEIAKKHNFILFEDRKFCDIGNTVKAQYRGGIYNISDWADIVNAHSVPGEGVLKGLHECVRDRSDRGCLLIAEMSPQGNLAKESYTKATVTMAENNSDFVIGFISMSPVSDDPKFIHMTPGVNLDETGDKLGQQYLTPNKIIRERGCDVIIVGRGITLAANRLEMASRYRNAGWKAYNDRIKS